MGLGGNIALYFTGVFLISSLGHCSNALFNRGNTAVLFNPVFPTNGSNDSYNPDDYIPMIALIATKFTKVTIGVLDETDATTLVIPFAVATYNRFHLKAGESPLELSISFIISDVLKDSATGSPNGWNSVLKILDEANTIFPGTVKQIYFEHSGLITDLLDKEVKEFEHYFATDHFQKSTKYELGISLPIRFCKLEGLQQVSEHIQHLSFYAWPNIRDGDRNQAQHVLTERIFNESANCKRKIEGYGKNITIRIETGWSYQNQTDGPEHDKKLARYWTDVNNWAEVSNTSVLFWVAFDNPDGAEEIGQGRMGLWRLVPNPLYKEDAKYSFEEKGNIPTSSSISWVLLCFILFIILAVVTLSTFIVVKYFYPNVFYTKVTPYLPDFIRSRVE